MRNHRHVSCRQNDMARHSQNGKGWLALFNKSLFGKILPTSPYLPIFCRAKPGYPALNLKEINSLAGGAKKNMWDINRDKQG
jgi:hypothetical protein